MVSALSGDCSSLCGQLQLQADRLAAFKRDGAAEAVYRAATAAREARESHAARQAERADLQTYAVVRVGTQVVAEVDNQGVLKVSDDIAALLGGKVPGSVDGANGPELARIRTESVAGLLGGRVELSASALSREEFEALPSQARVAGERLQGSEQARTLFLAQQEAQGAAAADPGAGEATTAAAVAAAEPDAAFDAEAIFLDYVHKTPEERYYEAILREKGLTEEQLAAMPAAERQRIEQEIREEIEKRMALQAVESGEQKVS